MYKISKAGLHNVMIGTNTGYSIGDIGLSYSLTSLTSRSSFRTYETIILKYLPPNPLRNWTFKILMGFPYCHAQLSVAWGLEGIG